MKRHMYLHAALFALAITGSGLSQTTTDSGQQASAPAPPPPPATTWKLGSFAGFSGMVDGFYSVGFDHPVSNINQLRNFDDKANQIDLNLAKFTFDHAAKPIGFHVDVGLGRAIELMSATEKDATVMKHFEQAFITVKPDQWKGVQLDFGKFVTSAGAEVLETNSNWNYSRSLLFALAIPYYHMGMRATVPVGKQFTGGFQWVGGWNNIMTGATYRTFGFNGAWTKPKFTWTNVYYVGPDENKADRGMRNLYDTTLLLTPNSKANFYINFDYGHDSPKIAQSYHWVGLAGAAKLQVTKKFYVSPRVEIFSDGSGALTGASQKVKELTFTGNYAILDRLSGFLEFRKDWSDTAYFNRGNQRGNWKGQPTVLIGMVAIIGPKR